MFQIADEKMMMSKFFTQWKEERERMKEKRVCKTLECMEKKVALKGGKKKRRKKLLGKEMMSQDKIQ